MGYQGGIGRHSGTLVTSKDTRALWYACYVLATMSRDAYKERYHPEEEIW